MESNPLPARDAQRAQTNLVCTKTQRPHKEPDLCLSVSCKGTGVQWPAAGTGALGAADLGMTQALLEEVTINPTIEPPEVTRDWGNRLLEGTNRTSCAPGPRRKEQGPYKRLTRSALGYPSVCGGGVGQQWPVAGSGALSASVHTWDLLKEVTIIFITSTIVWPQVKQQGGKTALPINRKLGLKIY